MREDPRAVQAGGREDRDEPAEGEARGALAKGGEPAALARLARDGEALDAQRWSARNQIGGFVQRAASRGFAAAAFTGVGVYASGTGMDVALFALAACTLTTAFAPAFAAVRYRALLGKKWADETERLVLRLARARGGSLRVHDVAADLSLSIDDADAVLGRLVARGVASADVDEDGTTVHLFPV